MTPTISKPGTSSAVINRGSALARLRFADRRYSGLRKRRSKQMHLFNRRNFLLMWIARPRSSEILTIEVLEIFRGSSGPCAVLVHHSSAEARQDFSNWLHRFDGAQVQVRKSDFAARGRMFRVKMCFGRGLLLLPEVVNLRVKDQILIEPVI